MDETLPNPTSDIAPDTTPRATPGATPDSTSGATPNTTSGATLDPLRPGMIDGTWKCSLSSLDEQGGATGVAPESITIGERFQISCEGSSVDLAAQNLALELPKESKFAVKILETKALSKDGGEFIATSWQTGVVNLPTLYLIDGARRVDLGPFNIEVKYVLSQENNKAFDPWGPVGVAWPTWVWISILISVLAIALIVISLIRKSMIRKRLLLMLERNPIATTPYNHFNKELRRLSRVKFDSGAGLLEKQRAYLRDLKESFRWYLARELVVPALELRPRQVVSYVKRMDGKLYKQIHRDLYLVLSEIDQSLAAKSTLPEEDLQQLTDLSRSLADKVHAWKLSVDTERSA